MFIRECCTRRTSSARVMGNLELVIMRGAFSSSGVNLTNYVLP